jgi:isochorismate hydrolase
MAESRSGKDLMDLMRQLKPYMSSHRNAQHKFSPKGSALLVIDMQKYFLEKTSHAYLPSSKNMVTNVRNLVDAYHDLSLPVIFTRHAHLPHGDTGAMGRWWGDLIREGDTGSELSPEMGALPRDTIIRKAKYSAFVETELDETLRSLHVSSIVITGVMTHLCCESTARDAFMRDLDVFFVIDGTASETQDLHVSSLKTLTDGFAIPVTTKEVLGWLRKRR